MLRKLFSLKILVILILLLAACNKKDPIYEEGSILVDKSQDILEVANKVETSDPSLYLDGTINLTSSNYDLLANKLENVLDFSRSEQAKPSKKYHNAILELKEVVNQIDKHLIIGTREVGKYLDRAQMVKVESNSSKVEVDNEMFISFSKPRFKYPLIIKESQYANHQLSLFLDAVYPIEEILITSLKDDKHEQLKNISVEVGFDNIELKKIGDFTVDDKPIKLGGATAKVIKIIIPGSDDYIIQDIKLFVGEGIIVKDAPEWSDIFKRLEGWTGADGVYSYNLTNGDRSIGAKADAVGFVYSDTIVGKVYPHNGLRYDFKMINNSLSYYDTNKSHEEAMEYEYDFLENGKPESVFLPHYYIGNRAQQLVDATGLKPSYTTNGKLTNDPEGTMWLAEFEANIEIIFDLYKVENLNTIAVWNYNGVGKTDYGVKNLSIEFSNDGLIYTPYQQSEITKAPGTMGASFQKVFSNVNTNARYVKFKVNESYSTEFVGLGKVLLLDSNNSPLFSKVTATKELTDPITKETSARLWLEDGIVIGDKFYSFSMLIKDDDFGFFTINTLGAIEVPIVNERFDYKNAVYHRTPFLTNTSDGARMYFGGGVLDLTNDDGYVYIYGFKDLNGRHMVVARTTYANILNFNEYTYWDGVSFQPNIDKSRGILARTSPELSITKITSGKYKNKYMVVTMMDTLSGRIGYSIGDNPWGPFHDLTQIYRTHEEKTIKKGAFTYNAKLQPLFSSEGRWLVTYNVNSSTSQGLLDYNVYYPRGLWFIEVTKDES